MRVSVWAAALTSLLALGGCSEDASVTPSPVVTHTVFATPAPEPVEVVEDLDLPVAIWVSSQNAIPSDGHCMVWGGPADLTNDGLQARILDESGVVIGVSTLGEAVEYEGGCIREARVTVPGNRNFYQLQVLRWESPIVARGDITDESFKMQVN